MMLSIQAHCPECEGKLCVAVEEGAPSVKTHCPGCDNHLKVHLYPSSSKIKYVQILDWRAKAHRLIFNLCWESWYQAQHDKHGKRYKKHHPYTVPELAEKLVACLGARDQAQGELEAKAIFLSYDGIQATY